MLNAAIIGLGGWGQKLVRAVHGKSGKIRIARAVTRTPAKAADFTRETDILIGNDYAAVLADPGIDAVIIATPHSQHVDQIVAAAGADKHVFVEKPLALTRADVAEAFDACEHAGVMLAVGQNRRFLPGVREIERLLRSGALGKLLHMEGNFSGPSGARHAVSNWRASSEESPWGGMTGKGLHLSDLMILLAGPIAEVHARSKRRVVTADLDDVTVTLMDFTSGVTGTLATLTATADMFRLRVFGSAGWAELDGQHRLRVALIGEEERVADLPKVDIERAELEAFADAVAGRMAYPVTRHEAENNIAFLEAIGRSVAAGGPVSIQSDWMLMG
jgi:predicted dehydrogenase